MSSPEPLVADAQPDTSNAVDQEAPESFEDFLAQATAHYAQKNYKTAAELYSRATELQAQINGEMSPKNADLLYLYGRCLYHVAVEKSDVLGSKVAGERQESSSSSARPKTGLPEEVKSNGTPAEDRVTEEVVAAAATEAGPSKVESKSTESKPYFQFTGDENFDNSDDEEGEEDGGGAGASGGEGMEEEDDDFSNAFEILDLARILLQKKLEHLPLPTSQDAAAVLQLKERLADTHDLQAEISLEGEQFQDAVNDLRAALALKKELHPPESSLVAEIHYKLSLALEFSSVTQPKDESGEVDQSKVATIDEALREDAAVEMEAAIASCKLRIEKEEATLSGVNGTDSRGKITRKSINDVKEMVQDMEQRLVELRQPPVSINDPKGTGSVDGATPLSGILGSILGESAEAQKARIEEATREAKDLSGLVKRKKPIQPTEVSPGQSTGTNFGAKRKADFAEEVVELGTGKRAKVEDGDD